MDDTALQQPLASPTYCRNSLVLGSGMLTSGGLPLGKDARIHLCTLRLLSLLHHLIVSKYSSVQVNSVAVLVNLSLENANKVKIVRSGIVPPLIDVLRDGFPEAQDHAAGALFSLALDEQNKTAIGVLGALPPLLHT
ncbi:hypothetical protein L1887_36489 [Cichorium endivia]|nr:hypothetical protein L1887_36489 [Cichorium endivia]